MAAKVDTLQSLLNEYFRARREGKPLITARAIAAAVSLPVQADVDQFIRRVRMDKGIQDLALIGADRPYSVEVYEDGSWKPLHQAVSAGEVRALASHASEGFSIRFPNEFQYGYAVFYTTGGKGYRAFSADYAPSETYLSM